MQVQALRSIEQHLGLEKLYVLGTNCVDNGPRKGLDKFLRAASTRPDEVLHYEFMQASWGCLAGRGAPWELHCERCFAGQQLPTGATALTAHAKQGPLLHDSGCTLKGCRGRS